MPPAARMTDNVIHDIPHCHAPIHPPSPTPTPIAHPPIPLAIVLKCTPTVIIEGQQAAVIGSMSKPCSLPSCVPAGPGTIAKGSTSVLHCGQPAARANDIVMFSSCVAPIGSPTGKILPPCAPTVQIGG